MQRGGFFPSALPIKLSCLSSSIHFKYSPRDTFIRRVRRGKVITRRWAYRNPRLRAKLKTPFTNSLRSFIRTRIRIPRPSNASRPSRPPTTSSEMPTNVRTTTTSFGDPVSREMVNGTEAEAEAAAGLVAASTRTGDGISDRVRQPMGIPTTSNSMRGCEK